MLPQRTLLQLFERMEPLSTGYRGDLVYCLTDHIIICQQWDTVALSSALYCLRKRKRKNPTSSRIVADAVEVVTSFLPLQIRWVSGTPFVNRTGHSDHFVYSSRAGQGNSFADRRRAARCP